jgi:purine-nucleoside phosphorylase
MGKNLIILENMKKIGIILGSGLDKFSNELKNLSLLYEDTVGIHHKRIIKGNINDVEVVIFQGRNHFYETSLKNKIYFNVNNAKELGLDLLIITNAAGGVNENFKVSDLMLITSHINLLFKNISFKKHINLYDNELIERVKKTAQKNKIRLQTGVYCSLTGPVYETNAEIGIWKKFNIDAAGMSTIPEILYASKLGIKTIAISCITNLLDSTPNKIIDHSEVIDAGAKAYKNFSKLLKALIDDY